MSDSAGSGKPRGAKRLVKATEAQLRVYGAEDQIAAARIVKAAEGYFLTVSIRWMRHDLIAFTTRKKPRSWASLDNLYVALTGIAPELESVELMLTAPADWTSRLRDLELELGS